MYTFAYICIAVNGVSCSLVSAPTFFHRLRSETATANNKGFRIAPGPSNVFFGSETDTVNSKKLEYGPGTICAGYPSSLGFEVGGQSHSNFLAHTVS